MSRKNKFFSLLEYDLLRNFNLILANAIIMITIALFMTISNFDVYSRSGFISPDYILGTHMFGESTNIVIFLGEMFLVLLFSIFIWKREFDFEHKTIYRTLSLPISKWKIVLSKSIIVGIFYGFYLVGQIVGVFMEWAVLKILFSDKFIVPFNLLKDILLDDREAFFLPRDLLTLFMFGIFITAISLIGAAYVLIKKSYGFKGILMWILGVGVIIYASIIFPIMQYKFLEKDRALLEIIGGILVIVILFILNNYLLKKKVNV